MRSRITFMWGQATLISSASILKKKILQCDKPETQKKQTLPLHGIQVIDFSHELAGSAASMILADLGATIVRVEKPKAPKHSYDAALNRSKHCLTLDLKSKNELQQAHQLIAKADVLIEDNRPGIMTDLGLDFKQLCATHPQLVTLSLPTFSKNDKAMRNRRGSEAMLATHSGVFSNMGSNRTLMGYPVSFSPLPLASAYGATIGASAVVLALQSREKTGYGDCLEVPLAGALTEGLIAYNAVRIQGKPTRYKNLREKEIERRIKNNIPFDLSYQELFSSRYMDPFFRYYRCQDGRLYYLVSIAHKQHPKRAMKSLGVYDKVMKNIEAMHSSPIQDVYLPKSEWGCAGSFETYPVSPEWSDMINQEMEQAFLTKTALEWEKILSDHGAIGGAVRTLEEWMGTEHVLQSGLFVEVNDMERGPMLQPGPIAWSEELADTHKGPYASRQRITLTEALEILKQPPRLSPSGTREQGWLEGVRVLDLSNVIAGPHTGTILARYGANVIKIDPAQPSFGPSYITYAFNSGQSKRSVLVDIRSTEGYQILTDLIKDTDIIIFNGTTKQIAQLKLDNASIKKINPHVIFCHLDLYGGPHKGPMTDYLGYDDVAQAVSGIMTRFGGGLDTPEEHAHLGTLDVMCGFAATLSIAAALYYKERTGKSLRARTSLAAMSGLLQIPFSSHHLNHTPTTEPSGRNIKGYHALSRFYECADGWIFMDSHEEELDQLEKIFPEIATVAHKAHYLEHCFKQQPTEVLLQHFITHDIAAARLNSMDTIRDQHTLSSEDMNQSKTGSSYLFTQCKNHPSGHEVTTVAPCAVRPQYARLFQPTPTEQYGRSTRRVLEEQGYSNAMINALIKKRVVSESWSKTYYPK